MDDIICIIWNIIQIKKRLDEKMGLFSEKNKKRKLRGN